MGSGKRGEKFWVQMNRDGAAARGNLTRNSESAAHPLPCLHPYLTQGTQEPGRGSQTATLPSPRAWTPPEALGPGAGGTHSRKWAGAGLHPACYTKALVELTKMGALLGWISSYRVRHVPTTKPTKPRMLIKASLTMVMGLMPSE